MICFIRRMARRKAKGFMTCCDNTTDDWPVEHAAEYLLEQLEDLRRDESRAARGGDRGWRSEFAG